MLHETKLFKFLIPWLFNSLAFSYFPQFFMAGSLDSFLFKHDHSLTLHGFMYGCVCLCTPAHVMSLLCSMAPSTHS